MTRNLLVAAALAGCATQAPAVPAEEEAAGAVGIASTPSPVGRPVAPRPTPSKASRTRPFTGLTAPGSGSHLTSTAYCETGLMANGHRTHKGAVAANRWSLGTVLRVSDSPYGPGTFTVEDRYGWGTQLDFATPGNCDLARAWGRHDVRVVVLP